MRENLRLILWGKDLSKMAVVICWEMSLILLEAATRGCWGGEGRADQLLPPLSLVFKTLVFIMKEQQIALWGWAVEVRHLSFSLISRKVERSQPNYPQRQVSLIIDWLSLPFHRVSETNQGRPSWPTPHPRASIGFHLLYILYHLGCPLR